MKEMIVVVEDDADIADIAAIALRREGYHVTMASDGAEGWALLQRMTPDLVLLDVAMPRKDGMQILSEARRHPRLMKTPIIMMTARNRSSDVSDALGRGASDYLVKPFEIEDLVRKVNGQLRRRQAQGREEVTVRLG